MSELPRKILTPEQAEELLPDGDVVHTFRMVDGKLVGSDWPRQRILERFKTHGVEIGGENCKKMNHGLVSTDDTGLLFIENRREKKR